MPATTTTLSERERDVLQGVARGELYRNIGRRLYLSPRTVKRHALACREKYGVATIVEAVARAVADGMIEAR